LVHTATTESTMKSAIRRRTSAINAPVAPSAAGTSLSTSPICARYNGLAAHSTTADHAAAGPPPSARASRCTRRSSGSPMRQVATRSHSTSGSPARMIPASSPV
jgi:hypothetical protein